MLTSMLPLSVSRKSRSAQLPSCAQVGELDRALRYADALEAAQRAEPLPWAGLRIAVIRRFAAGESLDPVRADPMAWPGLIRIIEALG